MRCHLTHAWQMVHTHIHIYNTSQDLYSTPPCCSTRWCKSALFSQPFRLTNPSWGKPSKRIQDKDPRLAFVRPPKGPGALHEEIQVVLNLQQRIPAPAKYVVKSSVLMGDHTDVTVTKSISNPTEHQQNTTKWMRKTLGLSEKYP